MSEQHTIAIRVGRLERPAGAVELFRNTTIVGECLDWMESSAVRDPYASRAVSSPRDVEELEAEASCRLNRHQCSEALDQAVAGAGAIWFMGWLFTIGFANLIWWKIILGIVVWPLFLGQYLR